jgi:hypothetical protein
LKIVDPLQVVSCQSSRDYDEVRKMADAAGSGLSKALLVGRRSVWSSSLLALFQGMRCEPLFAGSSDEAAQLARTGEYDVVLSEVQVSGPANALASVLLGCRTCLYYVFPVERGCWWLPVVRHGKNIYGSPALRPAEFGAELRKLLREAVPMTQFGAVVSIKVANSDEASELKLSAQVAKA